MATYIKLNRICEYCGSEFVAQTTVTRYCSHKCSSRAYKARQRGAKIEASNKEVQLIKARPIEAIKAKEFLSLSDTCTLLGVSKRTIYRLIERHELETGKVGNRTIIRREAIDKLFQQPPPIRPMNTAEASPKPFDSANYYSLAEIKEKYHLTNTTLYHLIRRNNIERVQRGKFVYVDRESIDKLFL